MSAGDVPAGRIIDFHTHAFPDNLAHDAIGKLSGTSGIRPVSDGTLGGLLQSMKSAGISVSIVHSIATSSRQIDSIRRWSLSIRSESIIPFPSVHPDSLSLIEDLEKIAENGFPGIKLHPEYQDFFVDDDKMLPIYEFCRDRDMIIFFHAGEDISFPSSDRGSPSRLAEVKRSFGDLAMVAAHTGGWRRWEEAGRHLIGTDIYLETGYTRGYLHDDSFRDLLLSHRPDRLLFGSDSPWDDQKSSLDHLAGLGLPSDLVENICCLNGEALLKNYFNPQKKQ